MTILTALLTSLLATPAHAGERWLANDDYTDGDAVTYMGGFLMHECWASVFRPAPTDYPFSPKYIDMLVGGGSGEHIFIAKLYSLDGTDMATASLLGEEAISVTGSDTSWSRITVSELELGLPLIESGNLGVAVCHYEHDGFPSIGSDSGRDDGAAHFIYGDIGLGSSTWWSTDSLAFFGMEVGEWIMRTCIEGGGVPGSCDTVLPEPEECEDGDLGTATGAGVATGTTTGAEDDIDPGCGGSGGEDMAYSWTAPSSDCYRFDLSDSAFDTVLSLRSD